MYVDEFYLRVLLMTVKSNISHFKKVTPRRFFLYYFIQKWEAGLILCLVLSCPLHVQYTDDGSSFSKKSLAVSDRSRLETSLLRSFH